MRVYTTNASFSCSAFPIFQCRALLFIPPMMVVSIKREIVMLESSSLTSIVNYVQQQLWLGVTLCVEII